MGGTIAQLVTQGHTVTLLDMTDGEPTPFGDRATRARESAAAADILGVRRVQLGMVNREVLYSIQARHAVATIYRKVRPDLLFVPYAQDAHPDHGEVTRIAQDARFDAKLTKSSIPGEPWYPPRLIHYFCSHLRFAFPASFCLDISAYMEQKIAALRCYKSQFAMGRVELEQWSVLDYVRNINTYFGGTIRRTFAEPFFVVETLGLGSLEAVIR